MIPFLRTAALLAALALVTAACGGSGDVLGEDDGSSEPGPIGAWVLSSATPEITVPDTGRITLTVESDDGSIRFGGTAACNSYGGTVVLDDGAWVADGASITEMGCEPDLMAAEAAYMQSLSAVDAWDRAAADSLVLTGPGVELRFTLVPPVEPAAFESTIWELDGFVQGLGPDGAVSSTIGDAPTTTLVFATDGTMMLDTGCELFTGEWDTAGDEVVLPSFGVTMDDRQPCEDAAAQAAEQQRGMILEVLEASGFRAEVDEQRLTLTQGEKGLTFRATDTLTGTEG